MKLNIQQWDNSAALRLSDDMLSLMGVRIGDALEVDVSPNRMSLQVARPRYRLVDLMAEMSADGLPRVDGWEEMPVTGLEIP